MLQEGQDMTKNFTSYLIDHHMIWCEIPKIHWLGKY